MCLPSRQDKRRKNALYLTVSIVRLEGDNCPGLTFKKERGEHKKQRMPGEQGSHSLVLGIRIGIIRKKFKKNKKSRFQK